MRIGIDVGGTHTDAVLLDGGTVVGAHKAPTSADVRQGIIEALDEVLAAGGVGAERVRAVMIGTTQFTNAVIERRELAETAVIRACLPTGSGLPPMCDWPRDIAAALGGHAYMVAGGHLFDGREIAPLDEAEIDRAAADIAGKGVKAVAVAAAFSPACADHERAIARRVRARIPDADITPSREVGRLGILERENAALLNAALSGLARRVVKSMKAALDERGVRCPLHISQNDGTIMSAGFVARYPALTFSSGPTNSLRGAAALTDVEDAIVVDIGGTTADVGVLARGFPRESNSHIDVGGVRTNFRMPDILSIGLGGGSLVADGGRRIGPRSLGRRLASEGLAFGGKVLTATDIAVAGGAGGIGEPERVAHLEPELVEAATAAIHDMVDDAVDRMRSSDAPAPVVLVGGGAMLVSRPLRTASEVIRPEHAGVANAIGAAIAQVGGEAERIVSYSRTDRERAIDEVARRARARAVRAGAAPGTLRVLDVEEVAMSYMDGGAARLRVKVVGDLAEGAA